MDEQEHSKNKFLARFGSEDHIDDLLKHSPNYNHILAKNRNINPKQINRIVDHKFADTRHALGNPNATAENFDHALEVSKDKNGVISHERGYDLAPMFRHKNILPRHFDETYKNGHWLVVAHSIQNVRNHPEGYLDKASTHNLKDIRKHVARHPDTSEKTLDRLMTDENEEVRYSAINNHQNRRAMEIENENKK